MGWIVHWVKLVRKCTMPRNIQWHTIYIINGSISDSNVVNIKIKYHNKICLLGQYPIQYMLKDHHSICLFFVWLIFFYSSKCILRVVSHVKRVFTTFAMSFMSLQFLLLFFNIYFPSEYYVKLSNALICQWKVIEPKISIYIL